MLTWTTASFIPPTTTADPGALATQAQTLMDQSGRIIGRGSEVAQQMTTTAVDFSELVAAPLKQHSGFSLQASERAMEGAAWGSTVTSRWSTEVQTFIDTTTALKTDWDTAVGNHFGISRSAYPTVEEFHNAVNAAGAVKYQEVSTAANAAYDTFKAQAAAVGQQLAGGPTPANLQALAAGGAGGTWAMFNLFGAQAAPNLLDGAYGTTLAGLLASGLREDTLTPQVRSSLQSLMALLGTANAGKTLSADEMAFVENFLKGLDQPWPGHWSGQDTMLFALPDHLQTSTLSQVDQQLIMGAAGGGIIALSNSAYAKGALPALPPSVQGLVDRYFGLKTDGSPLPLETKSQLLELGALFGAANEEGLKDLKAGLPLSAALTLGVADTTPGTGPVPPSELLNILDVSTRNHDANAALLTGDLTHPGFGSATPEHVLRGVFGRVWSDGGGAAAGLIDWIPGALTGNDPHLQREAAESYMSVFKTMTNMEAGGHWNESAYTFFTDGYGELEGHQQAPIGVANKKIADALASSTIPFLHAFADPLAEHIVDGKVVELMSGMNWTLDPAQRGMYFDMGGRARMFELIMGSPTAADSLGEAVYAQAYLDAAKLPDWTDDEAVKHAEREGRLQGYLDSGYRNVQADGVEDADIATAQNKQNSAWMRAGAAVAKEVFTTHPALRAANWGWDLFVKEAFEIGKWGPNVTEAEGGLFSPEKKPSTPEDSVSLEDTTTRFGYSIIESLVTDPASGRTLDELHRSHPELTSETAPQSGQWRLRPLEDLLLAYKPLDRTTHVYKIEEMQESFRNFLGPATAARYNDYLLFLDDVRENYRETYSKPLK
jgi:hypothetical protein